MKDRPNIILVILDAVRADHLSCYGYFRKTSPNIDNIAKHGILYENAFSAAEWSPPSHASIFTGKYPSFHGTLGRNCFLDYRNTTIAEVLNSHGYKTAGVTSNPLVGSLNGFDKGFETYVSFPSVSFTDIVRAPNKLFKFFAESPRDFSRTLIDGPDLFTFRNLETIKKLIKSRNADRRPLFLFTNFVNCHAPYDPPWPFKKRFCNSFDESRFFFLDFLLEKVVNRTSERIIDRGLDIRKLKRISSDAGQFAFMAKDLLVSEKEWQIVKSFYDGEIAYLDYRFGQLIDFLRDEGMFDDTLVIVTSDHGDNFGDRGLASHHFNLYDSLIHVPLIIGNSGILSNGKRIGTLVSTVDIFPTIMDLLKIDWKEEEIQGRSLYPFKDRQVHDFVCSECGKSVTSAPLPNVPHFRSLRSKIRPYDIGLKCLRTNRYKYILHSNREEKLYDLLNDPSEKNNIAMTKPEKTNSFKKQLRNALDISNFGPDDFASRPEREQMIQRLKALGYI